MDEFQYQYRIYIGGKYGEDHPNHGGEIPHFAERVQRMVTTQFDGATIFTATGIWGELTEFTIVVEVLDTTEYLVKDFADWAKTEFAQDSVLVVKQEVHAILSRGTK